MAFQSVRGFKDVLPPESERAAAVEEAARKVLRRFGFRELRLPTLESKELYVKSTGETTDIVEKEMFTLADAGGRDLALRPEGTPGAVRAYLQHAMSQQGGQVKVFYMGSMFRAERPQAGRFREFEQIGVECFGNAHPAADAELVNALAQVLDTAGCSGRYAIHVNNLGDEQPDCRPAYRARLIAYLTKIKSELCEHCQARLERNPLRVLDCKGDGPKLKERKDLPQLEPCAGCKAHFEAFVDLLAVSGLECKLDPNLVRGLDYYTRTVFEFKSSSLGSQDAIAGGGRYDGLIKSMGGAETPAVGWALGLERVLLAARPEGEAITKTATVYVAAQSEDAKVQKQAYHLLNLLRAIEEASLVVAGGLFDNSLKSQMRDADRQKARYVVIFGDAEAARGECVVKDMTTKDAQWSLKQQEVLGWLRERLSKKNA